MPDTHDGSHRDQLHAEALRLDLLGAHEHSEPLFAQLLVADEARLGPDDPDLAPALNDLARCRFNAGRLLPALRDYRRLLTLLEHDPDDVRIPLVRHQIQRCLEGVRQRLATGNLQAHLSILIRQARAHRSVGETAAQEHLRALARRLIARGRVSTGAQLMQRWLGELLQGDRPIDAHALIDMRDHAIALWNAGHPELAEPMLRDIVRVLRRQQADRPTALAPALRDWGSCLAAAGQPRSARETLALAESVCGAPVHESAATPAPRGHYGEATPPAKRASPFLHDLMLAVLQRSTFMFGLYWEGDPERLDLRVEGDVAHVTGAIRFDGTPGPWLPISLSAPAEVAPTFPHLDASLRLPQHLLPTDEPQEVLRVLSRLSRLTPGVTTVHDSDSGDITLTSRVVFSGCGIDDHTPADRLRVPEEVTLNAVVGLLSAAQTWIQHQWANQGPSLKGCDDDERIR